MPKRPDVTRYRAPAPPRAAPELVARAAAMLRDAARPLLLMGRVSRSVDAWNTRIALAEALNARVLTDLKIGAAFPTDHPLHAAPPGVFLTPDAAAVVRDADVILSLDWVDLAGTLKQGFGNDDVAARVIQVSMDQVLHNGIHMDHQGLPPTDLVLFCDPESAVDDLAREIGVHAPKYSPLARGEDPAARKPARSASAWWPTRCATALEGRDACLIHLPLGWAGDMWHFRHPLDFVGSDGGGGIGAGPGLTVGGAIALKGTARLPVSILGDGDFLMGATAFWTAANARVPLLAVVCNNRSFFNDEVHQERVAKTRGRPVENRWIGQRIDDPAPDLAHDRARAGPPRHRSRDRRRSACAGAARRGGRGRARQGRRRRRSRAARLQPGDGRGDDARARLKSFLEIVMPEPASNADSIRPDNVLPSHLDLYYGGQWHAPRGGEYAATINPANGQVIAKVAHAGAEDAGAAIAAAHEAFRAWAPRGAARARRAAQGCGAGAARRSGSARDARRAQHRQSRVADGRRRAAWPRRRWNTSRASSPR